MTYMYTLPNTQQQKNANKHFHPTFRKIFSCNKIMRKVIALSKTQFFKNALSSYYLTHFSHDVLVVIPKL